MGSVRNALAPPSRDARAGAPRGQAEHVHAHGHAAGVAIADLDVAIDHHGAAHESHGAHADVVAELLELHLDGGDARVGIAVADHAQARRLLAQHHADVLGAAEPDADDGRLAGEPALAELDQRVEVEPLDAVEAVGREQHAVIACRTARPCARWSARSSRRRDGRRIRSPARRCRNCCCGRCATAGGRGWGAAARRGWRWRWRGAAPLRARPGRPRCGRRCRS